MCDFKVMDTLTLLFLILAVVIALALTVLALLLVSGLGFDPEVVYGKPWLSQCTIAYKYMEGPYNSFIVGSTFTQITSIAPKAQILGIFYDDPDLVDEHNLRSVAACIIKREPTPCTSRDPIREDVGAVPDDAVQLLKAKGFKIIQLPFVDNAVITYFPYSTPFSLWLAPRRVYPKIQQFIESRSLCAYPMVEVYSSDRIEYMAPLCKQEQFFVPEAMTVNECDTTFSDSSSNTNRSTVLSSDNNESLEEEEALDKDVEPNIDLITKANDSENSSTADSFEEIEAFELEDKKTV